MRLRARKGGGSIHLSYSRLACFDRCPMEYYLTYMTGEAPAESGVAQYGSYIHSLLEKWAQGKASPELLRAEYPAGYDAAVSAPLPEGKELDYFERGLAYFSGFRGVLARHSPKVLMAEQTLSAQSPRAPYVGVLDLVLELKDGRRALVDHKSSLKASFYGAKGRERRRQLYLYAWLLKENFGFLPEVLCFNLFREKKELSFDFSETEYQETLLWMTMVEEELIPLMESCAQIPFDWPTRPDPFWCRNICMVRDRCPAQ